MGRDLTSLLDEIKDIRAEIHQRQDELAKLVSQRHDLVSEALGSGLLTFGDVARHCGVRATEIGLEFRAEVERRKRETKPKKARGGARPRPPRQKRASGKGNGKYIGSSDIARMAGVTRASVSNWKKRHEDFPKPAGIDSPAPLYLRDDVVTYLVEHGYLPEGAS
jgi:hypothetical protein